MPATRKKFWETKLNGNKERDKKVRRELYKLGWKILVVWECQIRKPKKTSKRIKIFIEK